MPVLEFLPVNDALSGEALARAQYLPFDETFESFGCYRLNYARSREATKSRTSKRPGPHFATIGTVTSLRIPIWFSLETHLGSWPVVDYKKNGQSSNPWFRSGMSLFPVGSNLHGKRSSARVRLPRSGAFSGIGRRACSFLQAFFRSDKQSWNHILCSIYWHLNQNTLRVAQKCEKTRLKSTETANPTRRGKRWSDASLWSITRGSSPRAGIRLKRPVRQGFEPWVPFWGTTL